MPLCAVEHARHFLITDACVRWLEFVAMVDHSAPRLRPGIAKLVAGRGRRQPGPSGVTVMPW